MHDSLPDDIRPALDTMAKQFDWWRKFDAEGYDGEVPPDNFIIAPPTWPSHRLLENWSALLRAAIAEITITSGEQS